MSERSAKPVRLGDVTTHISSGSTPRGGAETYLDSGPVILIRSQNVRMNELALDDVAYITDETDQSMKRSQLKLGDVLLNITGASIGRVACFELGQRRANVNQHVCIIRPKSDACFSRYLTHLIASPEFQKDIFRIQHGGTRQALTFAQIAEFKIPLPSLSEQKRIAEILDRAEALRAKRRAALALLDELTQSIFLDMFGDPVKNERNWPIARLDEVADVNRGKFTPRPRNDPSYYGGEFPFIQTGDISSCNGRLRTWTQTLNEKGVSVSRKFQPGTVVIAIVGATLGITAILETEVYCPDSVVGIVPMPQRATAEYVEQVLRWWRPIFVSQAPQTARANINLETLRPLGIPIPKFELQKRFSERICALEKQRTYQVGQATEQDRLFASLQHHAFRGEL